MPRLLLHASANHASANHGSNQEPNSIADGGTNPVAISVADTGTNDIYINTSMPKECGAGEGSTKWYHTRYLQDWAPSPSADVFEVPPDAQCAQGEAKQGSLMARGAAPRLAGARGALPFH